MCGIVGYWSNKTFQDTVIEQMNSMLRHRGPDDSGEMVINNDHNQVALGHRRLSILDLSTLGHQPMAYENLVIVFNGEIYNHMDIRRKLIDSGYTFISTSDTETLLKAFHKWGKDCLQLLNGMFAFAIYDKSKNELFLARDRLGIKPLYVYQKNGHFAFASELKGIMQFPGFDKEIDLQSLYSFFTRRYITKPKTIFRNTTKLEPGHYLIYRNNICENRVYWSLEDVFKNRRIDPNKSEQDLLDGFDTLLRQAIELRLLSDVPIGSLLSGGYDSSLVTAVMQNLSSAPIKTFSIGFDEKEYNEADYAKEVADYLGTDHHELYFPTAKFLELIPRIPEIYDEPFSDTSLLPSILLSEFTRSHVTVALSGDGGDELFCGYDHYFQDIKNAKYEFLGPFLQRIGRFSKLKEIVEKIDRRALKFFYFENKDAIINSHYNYTGEIYFKNLINGFNGKNEPAYSELLELTDNIQEKHMLQDMNNFLPEDILTKVDRASMAFALELRPPILDYRVVEYSFTVPHHYKYNKRTGAKKYLLKKLAYKYIPEKMLNRPKRGFVPPIEIWLDKELKWLIEKYLANDYLKKQGILNVRKVRQLVNRYRYAKDRYFAWHVWSLLMFQMWHERHIQC